MIKLSFFFTTVLLYQNSENSQGRCQNLNSELFLTVSLDDRNGRMARRR